MNEERGCRLELFMREYMEKNGSAQNGSKTSCKREAYPYLYGTVPQRAAPMSCINAALISSVFIAQRTLVIYHVWLLFLLFTC